MTQGELLSLAVKLITEYGPDAVAKIAQMIEAIKAAQPARYVTHCGICGEECPVYLITVDGKEIFRGKCSKHGFER